jgi:hypothetical protein
VASLRVRSYSKAFSSYSNACSWDLLADFKLLSYYFSALYITFSTAVVGALRVYKLVQLSKNKGYP